MLCNKHFHKSNKKAHYRKDPLARCILRDARPHPCDPAPRSQPQPQSKDSESLPRLDLGQIKLLHCSETSASFWAKWGSIFISKGYGENHGAAQARATTEQLSKHRCSVTTVLLCVYVSVHRDVWKHVSKMLITLISRELASLVICTVFFCTFLYRLIFTLHGNDFYKNSNAIFYTPSQPTHKGTPWTDYSNSTNRTGDTSEVPGKREGQARESERPGVSPGV